MRIRFWLVLAMCSIGCAGDSEKPAESAKQDAAAAPDAEPEREPDPEPCSIPSDCIDIHVDAWNADACCTPKTRCGYTLPEFDEETLMWYPHAKEYFETIAQDDPNRRCAPESFFFGQQVGLNEERYEEEGYDDVLIASTCSSFHLSAFTLAGCCLPDDTCGLSTHAYAPMFGSWTHEPDAPFAHPECVHAETLNEQFRASTLGALARLQDGGSCNYAEIDARQPNYF